MEEKIIEILKKYTFDNKVWDNFTPEMNLKDDLKINSARIVDIVLDMEEQFDIEISDAEIERMKTVQDIYEILKSKK
jgi:acyl carrier protein